jgi:uncharacterized protein (DUF1800 family)
LAATVHQYFTREMQTEARAYPGGSMHVGLKHLAAAMLAVLLAACGGGGGGGGGGSSGGGGGSGVAPPPPPVSVSAGEAGRFLTQATFGPTEASIEALRPQGFNAWLNAQIAAPPPTQSHQAFVEAYLASQQATNANFQLNSSHFYWSWWKQAVSEDAQLRQRMAFAYSQIFVISLADGAISGSTNGIRGAASYYDMLTRNAFGTYRQLLEDVTLHPAMGVYLTYLANQREDAAGTRTPDENYAREVMQLMSLGIYRLNIDGTVQTDSAGQPIPAYTDDDIRGLARVFTGLSWYHPTPTDTTFRGGNRNVDSFVRPMIAYNNFHSFGEKRFLGTVIPASTAATADTMGDLRIALDALANHPNVGPFMATRLIQQFVTSNPSPQYVERVARVFNDNGRGQRGDMGAVIRAVLTDTEARTAPAADSPSYGKLREPVIRMTNWMRAYGVTSASGNWLFGSTASNQSLGQAPLTSPSVFNFWRPGFTPPSTTQLGSRNLRAPEFQIVDEVSIAGYVNTMQAAIQNGVGGNFNGAPDLRAVYTTEIGLADDANALVERMNRIHFYGSMTSNTRNRLQEAVNSIAIPASTGSNQAAIDTARLNRVRTAVLLSMAAPDYIVQR